MRIVAILASVAFATAAVAANTAPPQYKVDASWPKPLPNGWLMGQASGVAVDAQDHIWVIQRPRSLTADEQGAALNPPRSNCCRPAPPVLEFDQAGNLLRSWGGPGQGYNWPQNEHGIHVDAKGFVWIGSNGELDGEVLKFTKDGKFVMQIGQQGPLTNSSDLTRLGRPAGIEVDTAANEVYIADGYYNHRVIVFDSETGAYKRHWGAYGGPPVDPPGGAYNPAAPVSKSFGNPVHCVKIARDGLVYVCDRINDRIQVFQKNGTFVREFRIETNTLGNGSIWDLALLPEAGQALMLNTDGENNEVRILNRATGETVGRFGRSGRQAGDFHWVHTMALDSKGNLFTGEVDNAKRVQKFVRARP